MTVPSLLFLAFSLAAAVAYNLPFGRIWRSLILLAANVAFLASFAPSLASLLPFAGFLLFGYVAVRALQAKRTGALMWLMVAATLFVFLWLKRYPVAPAELFLNYPYLTIGLSYVFFRVMHLVIDVGQGQLTTRLPWLSYINFTLNFLSLVSGPIQRYEDYTEQQDKKTSGIDALTLVKVAERVTLGVFKVFVVSMLLLDQHKLAVAALGYDLSAAESIGITLQIVLLYPLYLYANFSGYCDVVIALGRLFRLELPENFNRPFSSENFINFWSRWHITLSGWLKTYVYSPLMMTLMPKVRGGAAADALVGAFAFFVTFFLVGAWHGTTTEFLFFGLLQGGGVAVNKLYQVFMAARLGKKGYRALSNNAFYSAVCRGLTFVWFGFTMLWFWGDWSTIASLGLAIGWVGGLSAFVIALILMTAVLSLYVALMKYIDVGVAGGWKHSRVMLATAQLTAIWAFAVIFSTPAPEIVYKAF